MPKRKAVSPWFQGLVWGGCFTLTACLSALIGMSLALKTPLPVDFAGFQETIEQIKKLGLRSLTANKIEKPLNILLMGIDRVPNQENNPEAKFAGRSDTMLLIRFNPDDSSIKILSIPRDSRVELPDGRSNKINSANAIGGIDYTKETIANNLSGITVDKYIRVTSEAFEKLIDSVGGVKVYVPKDMQYTDQTQGLYIDLKEGEQVLNGTQAEGFVRYRKDSLGDIGRIQRQQILLKALQQKLQSPITLWQMPKIWKVLESEVDTDLTQKEIFDLATFSLGIDKQDIQMLMLPGRASSPQEYRLSYWLVDATEQEKMIQQYLDSSSSSTDDESLFNARIAIQNSTDTPQLAKKVALLLSQNGFQNVYVAGNHSPQLEKTQIIVQKGDRNTAKKLFSTLNFGEVEYSSTGVLDSDVTIVLGKDTQAFLENQ
jgi:LCP family protein required for cell wall assembly